MDETTDHCHTAPEAHQNDCSKLSEPTFDSLRKTFCMVSGCMEDFDIAQNCQNWGLSACLEMGVCLGLYGTSHQLV